MDDQQQQKRPLNLDWDSIITDDDPPALLVVKPSVMVSDQAPTPFVDSLDRLKDSELEENIQRKKRLLETTTGRNLPDGGAKLRATIKIYEDELSRRKVNPRPQKVDEEQKKTVQATSWRAVGVSNDCRQENLSSQPQSQSSFASRFFKKLEDNTNGTTIDAFKKEMSHFKHCNNNTVRHNGEPKGRKRYRQSSRPLPLSRLSRRDSFNDDKSCRQNSALPMRTIGMNRPRRFPKVKDASQTTQSDGSRSRMGNPIVLDDDDDDDDDEPHILEETENKVPEYLKGAKIYFPSRDDPESVEICYDDIECLSPHGYLTSTIMNFYIRYLQQQASLRNRPLSDYHFFNTYFYKKLKEAVSCKSDRETIFAKFRRWWKGLNIFQKAYVLIPIHEDLHWSLIIICIPDKEDELGPIILHLDSLGLHSSKSVFDNIRSFLIEEWNYLGQECASSEVSIADRIWKCLSRRIETQPIAVPQQKNEYDCGLFVLYFIKRFLEEAPERLKKKDLAMFGKKWFKSEEASGLRLKIKELLVAELHNSINPNGNTESSPSASATESVETAKDSLI